MMAERLMLFEPEDAEILLDHFEQTRSIKAKPDDLDLPRTLVTLTQLKAIRDVIANGNPSGKRDPTGALPVDMPAWGKTLIDDDIIAIIAHLISVYPWDE